jgi:hypothetical protein
MCSILIYYWLTGLKDMPLYNYGFIWRSELRNGIRYTGSSLFFEF